MKVVYNAEPKLKPKTLRLVQGGTIFVLERDYKELHGTGRERNISYYMVCVRNGHLYYVDICNGQDRPLNTDTPVFEVDCALAYYGIKAD